MGRKKTKVELDVYLNQKLVGQLIKESTGAHHFQYDKLWLSDDDALAISHTLPLRENAFKGPEVYNYFENLLPDNTEIRNKIAAKFSAQSSEPIDLLSKIGRDCVGALQFVPTNQPAPTSQKIESRKVSAHEIAHILKNLAQAPLGMDDDEDEFRISIAGAHEKTAFLKVVNEWHLPRGSTPTSHIFKPPIRDAVNGIDLTTSVENEWLCNKICQRLGLQVPPCHIETFEDQKVLVIERFDRRWSADSQYLSRIPIEDFCQTLGFPSSQKYEKDGGPGVSEIMNFLSASNARSHDRDQFMRSQIIFFLLNATDGHAKNFSIRLSASGFVLCPIYDVLSLSPALVKREIEIKKVTLAMGIGEAKRRKVKEILKRHYEQSAEIVGLETDYVETTLQSLQRDIADLKKNPIALPPDFPNELYDAVMVGIDDRFSVFE